MEFIVKKTFAAKTLSLLVPLIGSVLAPVALYYAFNIEDIVAKLFVCKH